MLRQQSFKLMYSADLYGELLISSDYPLVHFSWFLNKL